MKHFGPSLSLALGGILLSAGFTSAYTLTRFKAATPVKLHIPALPDSTQKENPFSNDKLLDARGRIFSDQLADWTTMTTDTAGNLTLVSDKNNPMLHTFTTRLRASRFTKGKLALKSTSMADVLVNGVSTVKKTTSDSLSTEASSSLDLNPEADYEIQVNLVSLPDDKSAPEFSLEFTPDKEYEDIALFSGPDIRKRFSLLATMTGERVYNTSLSPDGRYLLTKYFETFDKETTNYHAVLSETATGKVLSEDVSVYADWMPKGATLYYTTHKPSGYDVMTIEIPSMKVSRIAEGLPERSFDITPDQRYIIYYKNVDGKAEAGPLRKYDSPDDRIPGTRNRSYLMRYEIATHVTTPLTYGGAATSICDYSKDGSKMLYISSVDRPDEYPFYFKTLVEMDLNTLTTDTLIRNDGFINSAIYSPDAKQLFVLGSPQAFNHIGENIGDNEIANDFDNQGFLYTIATKEVKPITRDFNPSISNPVWNDVDGLIYLKAEEGFFNNVYSLNPKTGKFVRLDTKTESVSNFSIGDDEATWMAYYGGDFDNAGRAFLLNLKNGKSRLIDDPMQKSLADVEMGKMEPWTFKSKNGDTIDGYICYPPEFDPAKKYPLIVYYYGGTSPTAAGLTSPYAPQVFASRDYVVYTLNPSGTTGYGQEFSARHVNAWGKRTAEEIIEGVKKFCDAHPFVDRKKVGCLGASYGGFMTQYLQTLTDIFAAAVSHAGISNVTSYWGEGYWGYSYNAVAAAKRYPWTDPDLFTKQGSLFNADKIHTPLLLLHGTADTNVPIGESIQLFNALRILGRDVEFISVDGENHFISDFEKRILWQNTIMAWFAKYLQDDPKWWNSMYGK